MPLINCMSGAMYGSYKSLLKNVLSVIIHPGNQRQNVDLYNYVLNTHVLEKVDVVRDLGVHVDCFLKFDHHISFIVDKAMTRSRNIVKCFLSRNRELLLKAYCVICVYVCPLLEYCSAVWSPHLKSLAVKMESVQRFFTKRLQGMWNKGYNDHLRLLNTHSNSLEYRRIYSDLVLCFQLLSNVLIHSLSIFSLSPLIIELEDIISNLLNKVVLWMPPDITLQIVSMVSLISGTHYQAILLALQHSQHSNHNFYSRSH